MCVVVWGHPIKILATHVFKTLHFGLNFESNLAQGERKQGTLHSAMLEVVNYKSLEGSFCFFVN